MEPLRRPGSRKAPGASPAVKGMNPRISALDDLEKELMASSLARIHEKAKAKAAKPAAPQVEDNEKFKDGDVSEEEAPEHEAEESIKEEAAEDKQHFGLPKKKVRITKPKHV